MSCASKSAGNHFALRLDDARRSAYVRAAPKRFRKIDDVLVKLILTLLALLTGLGGGEAVRSVEAAPSAIGAALMLAEAAAEAGSRAVRHHPLPPMMGWAKTAAPSVLAATAPAGYRPFGLAPRGMRARE
jgi:hypothetical protein